MADIYRTAREEHYFYLGPSTSEFSPFSSGITFADPNYHIMRPNGDHYVFEYILNGRGYIYFNEEKVSLGPGAAYILHPCTYHHYYSDPLDPWTKIWLNARGMLVQHLLSDYRLNTNCYTEFPGQQISLTGSGGYEDRSRSLQKRSGPFPPPPHPIVFKRPDPGSGEKLPGLRHEMLH